MHKRFRRAARVKKSLGDLSNVIRISVFRSLNHIYAQAIDDSKSHTIASASSANNKEILKNKIDAAFTVGKALAEQLKQAHVANVVFDRGSYLYHGRIKAVAEGLRDGGIKF